MRNKLNLDHSDNLVMYRNNRILEVNIRNFSSDKFVAFIEKSEHTF